MPEFLCETIDRLLLGDLKGSKQERDQQQEAEAQRQPPADLHF